MSGNRKDWKDGAGVLLADRLLEFCELVPGFTGADSVVVDLTEDNGNMPDGGSDYQGEWDPPGQTQSAPLAFNYEPGPSSGRFWQVLESWSSLREGQRVRATWSWDGCGASGPSEAPISIAVDFDLFLYNVTTGKYVWASQSVDDSNEGFDYTLQSGENGDYQLILAWPEGALSCEDLEEEAGAYAWRVFLAP